MRRESSSSCFCCPPFPLNVVTPLPAACYFVVYHNTPDAVLKNKSYLKFSRIPIKHLHHHRYSPHSSRCSSTLCLSLQRPSSASPAPADRIALPYRPLDRVISTPSRSCSTSCNLLTFRQYLIRYVLELLVHVSEKVVNCIC